MYLFLFARFANAGRLLLLFFVFASAAPILAQSDWQGYHRAPTNDVHQPIASTIQVVGAGSTWQTSTTEQLYSTGGMAVGGGYVVAVAESNGTTAFDPSDDTFRVRAYDPFSGTRLWSSPFLPPGNAVSYQSITSPAIDANATTPSAYIAANNAIYRLKLSDGSIMWSQAFYTTNTTPGLGGYEVINSSPVTGAGKVFIEVSGGTFNSADKQIVAMDALTGSISWFHNDKGQGLGTPVMVDLGSTKTVYTAIIGGVAAYDAVSGAKRWTNHAVLAGTTWTLNRDISGSMVFANGRIYATTYSFVDTETELVCIDANTGKLLFQVPAPTSDVVPLVLNGRVYVQGGPFGAARLAVFDAQTGAPGFNVETGGVSFRTIFASTNDRIYMTDTTRLMIVSPADGSILDSISGSYDGAVAIDAAGALYVHNGAALAAFRNFATAAHKWNIYQ